MDMNTKAHLLQEPPGPRRAFLALRAARSNQQAVAVACNCDRSTVSKVLQGMNSTTLHARIRAALAHATGMDEAWLFEHTASHRNTASAA